MGIWRSAVDSFKSQKPSSPAAQPLPGQSAVVESSSGQPEVDSSAVEPAPAAQPEPVSPETAKPGTPAVPDPPDPLVMTEATPASVCERNLTDLVKMLRESGLDVFPMRGYQPTRRRLGVIADERQWREFCKQHLNDSDWWISQDRWRRPMNRPNRLKGVDFRRIMHLYREVVSPSGGRPITHSAAVDVDLWQEDETGRLVSYSGNPVSNSLSSVDQVPLLGEPGPLADELAEPVDVVFTWVTDDDPKWRADYERVSNEYRDVKLLPLSQTPGRFRDLQELRYAIRSIRANLPWVDRIHIVTGNRSPEWLRTSDRLRVVQHRDLMSGSALPTFNSHAIESVLHRIPDLTEHFIYFNDDMFVCNPLNKQRFFLVSGLPIAYFSKRPIGLPGEPIPTAPAIAADNARSLLESWHGRSVDRTLLHIPYAMRKSYLAQLWDRVPEVMDSTMRAQFRRTTDIPPVFLHQWDALFAGRAATGRASYRLIDVGFPDARMDLASLRKSRRLPDFLSLNQREDAEADGLAALTETMQWLFPFGSATNEYDVAESYPRGD